MEFDPADTRWGNHGIRVYIGRVMFRRLMCNLYHWGLIIGSYQGKQLSDRYIAVNWGLNGLHIDKGLTFQEASQTIKRFGG